MNDDLTESGENGKKKKRKSHLTLWIVLSIIGAIVLAVVQAVLVVLGTVFGDPVPGRTDDA